MALYVPKSVFFQLRPTAYSYRLRLPPTRLIAWRGSFLRVLRLQPPLQSSGPIREHLHNRLGGLLAEVHEEPRPVSCNLEVEGGRRLKEHLRRPRAAVLHRNGHHSAAGSEVKQFAAVSSPPRTRAALLRDSDTLGRSLQRSD